MDVKYGATVFHAILDGLQDDRRLAQQEFEVRDDGVWLKPIRLGKPWHPWNEMLERGSPDPDDKPWLPIMFNARELAAFLVDGRGKHLVRINFGDWMTGPEEWTASCSSRLTAKAKEAMLDAYAAFRVAADAADHLLPEEVRRLAAEHAAAKSALRQFEARQGADLESEEYAELCLREYHLEGHSSDAYATDSEKRRLWQKAIVRRLLGPRPIANSMVGSVDDQSEKQPRVRWLQGLAHLLPMIESDGKKRDGTTVIRELKKRGKPWGIHELGPPESPDGLRWTDSLNTAHDVTKKTVQTAISRVRKGLTAKAGAPADSRGLPG